MPEYPRDEFDELAAKRRPVGAHRRKEPLAPKILLPILIIIAAGALGYVGAIALENDFWRPQAAEVTPTPTIVESVSPEASESATPSPSATASATPTPTETAVPVNFGASVAVFNASGISGLAGKNADELTAAGFTTVSAGNLSANLPAANTVRYADATMETTAREVARVLGIATVEQGVTPEGDVSVILITNPDA